MSTETPHLNLDPVAGAVCEVRCGDTALSHAEISDRASRISTGLAAVGAGLGDRVAIVLRNDLAYPQLTTAARALGLVPVPVNWHWKGDEIRHVLEDSASKVAFVHTELCPMVETVLPAGAKLVEVTSTSASATGRHPTLDEWVRRYEPWTGEPPSVAPTSMIYTSGTTGRPKGVLRDPGPPEAHAERVRVVLATMGLERGMRTLIPAPLYHTAPHIHMNFALQAGDDITIMPRFDAEGLLRAVEEHRINHIQVVPTMFVRLLQLPAEVRDRYDLSSLKVVVHAAAACPAAIKRQMIEWLGPIIREYYGGTEIGAVVACDAEEWLAHPGTVGRPVADAEVRVIDAAGTTLGPMETGELYIKPPTCQPPFTYNNLSGASAAMIKDGFVSIGDIGHVDHDGFVYITDRASDMVISGGVNIYPAEIEACLSTLEGVHDAAVFGIPHPEFGEALVAHVQCRSGALLTEAQVADHIRANLAGYKVPRTIVFDPDLPRDDSGKLVKRRLRERYARSND